MKPLELACVVLFAACAPSDPLPKPAPEEGFQMEMRVKAAPGEEVWKCQIGPLPIDEPVAVNRVEHVQTDAVHHMDIMVLLNVRLPEGTYDCDPLYREHPELMEETILYASQRPREVVQLPPGVAARVPPGLTVMYELHHVNASPREEEVFAKVNAYTIPAREVTSSIWGKAIRDRHLVIPAGATGHDEWSRCKMTRDVDLLFVSTHTHRLGFATEVFQWKPGATGEKLYENREWDSPALKAFPTPLHVPAGEGFEFHCKYANDTPATVNWGFTAAEEMCNLGIVYTPGDADIDCDVVETSDGVIMR